MQKSHRLQWYEGGYGAKVELWYGGHKRVLCYVGGISTAAGEVSSFQHFFLNLL